jgi:peptidoglycan/LPS O-acetylase OafA/YrhL
MPSPTLQELSRSRSNNFDFLRFAMACLVIHTHSYAITGTTYPTRLQTLLHLDFGGAPLAVNVFFLISGFLISSSFNSSATTLHYLQKRFLRIYPGFFVALAFCVFAVGPLSGVDLSTYFRNPQTYKYFFPLFFAPLQPLPGAFAGAPWPDMVNSSLWTIRFEIFCYLLPPLLALLGIFRYRSAILALFLTAIVAQNVEVHQIPNQWTLFFPWFGNVWELPRFLMYFLAGMTFYAWRDRIRLSPILLLLSIPGFCIGMVHPDLKNTIFPISLTYLIFYIAFTPRIPLQHFGRHGDFSYGMYLYAFPVQQLLVRHVPIARNPLLLTPIAFVATFSLAFLSWHLVEHPCLKLKNKGRAAHTGNEPISSAQTATAGVP